MFSKRCDSNKFAHFFSYFLIHDDAVIPWPRNSLARDPYSMGKIAMHHTLNRAMTILLYVITGTSFENNHSNMRLYHCMAVVVLLSMNNFGSDTNKHRNVLAQLQRKL